MKAPAPKPTNPLTMLKAPMSLHDLMVNAPLRCLVGGASLTKDSTGRQMRVNTAAAQNMVLKASKGAWPRTEVATSVAPARREPMIMAEADKKE